MASIYDRADIYDLIEDEKRFSFNQRHWQIVLEGKEIHSLLDVSIGSGSLTLPLAELGVELFGSDLSASIIIQFPRHCCWINCKPWAIRLWSSAITRQCRQASPAWSRTGTV